MWQIFHLQVDRVVRLQIYMASACSPVGNNSLDVCSTKKKTTRRKIYNSTLSYKLISIAIWKVDDLIIVVGVTQKLVLPATINIFHNRLNCRSNGLYCTEFSDGLVVILVLSSRSSKFWLIIGHRALKSKGPNIVMGSLLCDRSIVIIYMEHHSSHYIL